MEAYSTLLDCLQPSRLSLCFTFGYKGRPHLRRQCPTLQRSAPRTKTTCRAPLTRSRPGSSTPRPPASCRLRSRGNCGGSPARPCPGTGSGSGFSLQRRVTTAWLGTTLLKYALRVDDAQQLKVQRYRGGTQCLSVPWFSCTFLHIAGQPVRRNAASTPASAAAARPTWPCCGATWPLQVASAARLCSLQVTLVIAHGMDASVHPACFLKTTQVAAFVVLLMPWLMRRYVRICS
jgi:hypothetical protein